MYEVGRKLRYVGLKDVPQERIENNDCWASESGIVKNGVYTYIKCNYGCTSIRVEIPRGESFWISNAAFVPAVLTNKERMEARRKELNESSL